MCESVCTVRVDVAYLHMSGGFRLAESGHLVSSTSMDVLPTTALSGRSALPTGPPFQSVVSPISVGGIGSAFSCVTRASSAFDLDGCAGLTRLLLRLLQQAVFYSCVSSVKGASLVEDALDELPLLTVFQLTSLSVPTPLSSSPFDASFVRDFTPLRPSELHPSAPPVLEMSPPTPVSTSSPSPPSSPFDPHPPPASSAPAFLRLSATSTLTAIRVAPSRRQRVAFQSHLLCGLFRRLRVYVFDQLLLDNSKFAQNFIRLCNLALARIRQGMFAGLGSATIPLERRLDYCELLVADVLSRTVGQFSIQLKG